MPSDTYGFTGTEILSHLVSYTGNNSSDFQDYMAQILPLAEFRFCKMHDWKFLTKRNRSLSVTQGTTEYALSTSTIGFYMAAEDVAQIYDPTANRFLKQTTLDEIRRMDPNSDDGLATDGPTHWAPVGDNEVIFYPPVFGSRTLKVDGKITPGALSSLTNYPTIPYRYQDTFLELLRAFALDRENDDRATAKKQEAAGLLRADIQADVGAGGTDLPRMRHAEEARADGSSTDLTSLYNRWAFES